MPTAPSQFPAVVRGVLPSQQAAADASVLCGMMQKLVTLEAQIKKLIDPAPNDSKLNEFQYVYPHKEITVAFVMGQASFDLQRKLEEFPMQVYMSENPFNKGYGTAEELGYNKGVNKKQLDQPSSIDNKFEAAKTILTWPDLAKGSKIGETKTDFIKKQSNKLRAKWRDYQSSEKIEEQKKNKITTLLSLFGQIGSLEIDGQIGSLDIENPEEVRTYATLLATVYGLTNFKLSPKLQHYTGEMTVELAEQFMKELDLFRDTRSVLITQTLGDMKLNEKKEFEDPTKIETSSSEFTGIISRTDTVLKSPFSPAGVYSDSLNARGLVNHLQTKYPRLSIQTELTIDVYCDYEMDDLYALGYLAKQVKKLNVYLARDFLDVHRVCVNRVRELLHPLPSNVTIMGETYKANVNLSGLSGQLDTMLRDVLEYRKLSIYKPFNELAKARATFIDEGFTPLYQKYWKEITPTNLEATILNDRFDTLIENIAAKATEMKVQFEAKRYIVHGLMGFTDIKMPDNAKNTDYREISKFKEQLLKSCKDWLERNK